MGAQWAHTFSPVLRPCATQLRLPDISGSNPTLTRTAANLRYWCAPGVLRHSLPRRNSTWLRRESGGECDTVTHTHSAEQRLPSELSTLPPARQPRLRVDPASTPTTCAMYSGGRDAHSHAHAHASHPLFSRTSRAASCMRCQRRGLPRFQTPQRLQVESAEPFPLHTVFTS